MAIQNKMFRKITNCYFSNFCGMVTDLLNIPNVRSDLIEASKDDSNDVNLYNDSRLNMECIEPDKVSSHFLNYMKKQRKAVDLEQPKAVDALCIDKKNNFYMIEFKNRKLYKDEKDNEYDSDIRKDLKGKMFQTLWMLLSMDSMAESNLLSSDVIEFARNHVVYIIVISRQKNIKEYNRIHQAEAMNQHYTPDIYKKYKGYYLKDVYMLTELEFRNFILHFKA